MQASSRAGEAPPTGSAAADLPLPNPNSPLVRVWCFQRFQIHTGFCVEDQDRLMVDKESENATALSTLVHPVLRLLLLVADVL